MVYACLLRASGQERGSKSHLVRSLRPHFVPAFPGPQHPGYPWDSRPPASLRGTGTKYQRVRQRGIAALGGGGGGLS